MTFRHNMYKLKEEREMSPKTFLNAVCSLLYEKRCVGMSCSFPSNAAMIHFNLLFSTFPASDRTSLILSLLDLTLTALRLLPRLT